MCEPVILTSIAIGAATGAVSSAITGGDVLQGALMGGITGGFFPGSVGVTPAGLAANAQGIMVMKGVQIAWGTVASSAAIGLAASIGKGLLLPDQPSVAGYTPASQAVQQNSQNIATTGSGGRQATASLADAIQRSKKRKLTQEDVGDLSIDTSSFANTGLQLA